MTEAETLREENQHLQAHMATLEAAIQETQRLQARIEELEARHTVDPTPPTRSPSPSPPPLSPPPPSPPPPLAALKDVKMDPPPEFDGKTSEYASFLGHCEFYFENKPSIYHDNDKNKVSLVISRLRGRPATWAHGLHRANPKDPVLTS